MDLGDEESAQGLKGPSSYLAEEEDAKRSEANWLTNTRQQAWLGEALPPTLMPGAL